MAQAAAPTTHILESQLEADNEDECETGPVPPGKMSEPGKIVETGQEVWELGKKGLLLYCTFI